jgi:hypothetical protein
MAATSGDVSHFKDAWHFSSWFGLTPKEYSSGNSRYLGRISKKGDRYLRMLLTHGARSVLSVTCACGGVHIRVRPDPRSREQQLAACDDQDACKEPLDCRRRKTSAPHARAHKTANTCGEKQHGEKGRKTGSCGPGAQDSGD